MIDDEIDLSQAFTMETYERLPDQQYIENPEQQRIPQTLTPADKHSVKKEVYKASKELVDAVNLGMALGRPLLIQGEPGCGKTRLAYALAYALALPLEIAPIKSTSRGQDLLYTYDAVRRLYDAQLPMARMKAVQLRRNQRTPPSPEQAAHMHNYLDIHRYIKLGPLGRAIARAQLGRRSVVLIDEIDKADLDFPNDLLWELDRLEFRVLEAEHTYKVENAKLRPIVIVTHNEEKALPTAFLRRCIFHYIAFPEQSDDIWKIIAAHKRANEELGRRAIEILLRLRQIEDLTKQPGISELLDWVGYLEAVKTPIDQLDTLPFIGALLKQAADQDRARRSMLFGE